MFPTVSRGVHNLLIGRTNTISVRVDKPELMNRILQHLRRQVPATFWKTGVLLVLISLTGLLRGSPVLAGNIFNISQDTLKKAEAKWGRDARTRLLAWENLIRSDNSTSDLEKLEKVNAFMNKIPYGEDIDVWGVDDYWATPIEFLGIGAGDCEDYAIAKYFTLKAMGFADEKLNITYVKAVKLNRTHMVLTYVNKPGDEPLVLDNLIDTIKPASGRQDLLPIFSFNGTNLWMAQQRGQGKVTDSSRLRPWRELLKRMQENNL